MEIDIKEAKKKMKRLKKKNTELSKELEITTQTDTLIRDKLSIKHRVAKLKSDNLKMLSSAKMQVVERNLDKRYDVDPYYSKERTESHITPASAVYQDQGVYQS